MYFLNEYDEKDGGMLFSIFIGVVIVTTFIVQIIIGIIASFLEVDYDDIAKTTLAGWIVQGGLYLVLLGAVFAYHKMRKINIIKANGLDKKFNVANIAMSVVLGLGMLFSFLIFTYLYSYFLQEIGYSSDSSFFEINNFGLFLAAVLIICVLPAVTEEIVFRGAVLNGFSKAFGVTGAVILSALFFMLMHMNLPQFVNALLSGIVLAVFVKKTKTLKVGVIAHFTNNFVLVFLTYMESFFESSEPENSRIVLNGENLSGFLILFVVGIVLLSGAFIYFFVTRKNGDRIATDCAKPALEKEREREFIFENENAFGNNRNEVPPIFVRKENKKTRALLYASFGIVVTIIMVVQDLFLV